MIFVYKTETECNELNFSSDRCDTLSYGDLEDGYHPCPHCSVENGDFLGRYYSASTDAEYLFHDEEANGIMSQEERKLELLFWGGKDEFERRIEC